MKILITGGSGYLGGRLSNYFAKLGHNVVSASRRINEASGDIAGFEIKTLNLEDIPGLKTLVDGQDTVIHLAAMDYQACEKDPELASKVNIEGTQNLIDACRQSSVRKIIYFSTIHVYGTPLVGSLSEETPCNPKNAYAQTHLDAEKIIENYGRESNIDIVIVRLSNSMGAPIYKDCGAWKLIAHDLILQALEKNMMEIKSSGLQLRNFIPLNEVEIVVSYFLNNKINGIYNVGSKTGVTILGIGKLVQNRVEDKLKMKIELKTGVGGEDTPEFSYNVDKISKLIPGLTGNLTSEIDAIIDFALKYKRA